MAPLESIRLFIISEAMDFAVLPVAGGLYDQHPQLLEEWMVIFNKKREYEQNERARQEAQMNRSSGGRKASRGRRR